MGSFGKNLRPLSSTPTNKSVSVLLCCDRDSGNNGTGALAGVLSVAVSPAAFSSAFAQELKRIIVRIIIWIIRVEVDAKECEVAP